MFPEYMVQQIADSGTVDPDRGVHRGQRVRRRRRILPRALRAYDTERRAVVDAVQRQRSRSSTTTRSLFESGRARPADPPVTIDELRQASQAIVDTGAAGTGIALDSGVDSGGGWFLEQWFARAGEPYADNGNGRLAPATQVLYDGPFGRRRDDAGAVADHRRPRRHRRRQPQRRSRRLLKLADPEQPAAMTIATSAALGTIINVLDGGLIPGITSAELGVGPMPGPGEMPVGDRRRGSLYIVADKGDAQAAAAWDYITVPDERPVAVDVGRRRPGTCRSARTPSSSTRSGRRTPPTPGSRSPTTRSLAGARRPDGGRPGDRARCARSARSPPAAWRRSSAAPTSRRPSPPTAAQSDAPDHRLQRPQLTPGHPSPHLGGIRIRAGSVPESGTDARPDRSLSAFRACGDPQAGVDLPTRSMSTPRDHHGLVTRQAAERTWRVAQRPRWYRALERRGALEARCDPGVARLGRQCRDSPGSSEIAGRR